MIRKTTLYVLIFCLSVCTLVKESTAQAILWKKDLKDDLYSVSWIEQTNDGTIIAAGDKGMMGIDNNTGNVLWTNTDLKAINRATFHSVENMPMFHVEYVNLLGKSKTVLLEAYTGKVLFDSKDEDIKIGTNHLLPEISSILFEVKQEGKNKLLLFNYDEAAKKWMLELGEADGGLKSIYKSAMGKKGFLKFSPVVIDNNKLLVGEKEKAHMIDIATGKMLWSQNMEDKLNALIYSPADKKVYMGIKKKLRLFDSATGTDVTDGKMKLGSSLEQIFTNTQGKLVLVASDGFNLLDPATGKFIWKKSYSQDGINQVMEVNGSYYAIGGEDESSVLSKIDNNGERIWKEKIDGMAYYIKPIEKGIFYLSTEKSNIITYEKGEKIWKRDLKFKTVPSFDVDTKNNEVIFYENKGVYKFNLSSGNLDVLNEEIKFKNAKEYIFNLEVRPSGYFIHSDQHIAMIDRKGALTFNEYYSPVTSIEGLASVGQLVADAYGIKIDIAGSLETLSSLDKLKNGSLMSAGDQNEASSKESVMAGLYTLDGNGKRKSTVFEVTEKRYFNSKITKDHKYILSHSGTEGTRILMVNKESGVIDKKIALVDSTPNYIADEIDERVFVNEKNHLITCYNMK
jgi:outer membrane protein assembly factor BamB